MRSIVLISGIVVAAGAAVVAMNSNEERTPEIVQVQSEQMKVSNISEVDNSLEKEINKLEKEVVQLESTQLESTQLENTQVESESSVKATPAIVQTIPNKKSAKKVTVSKSEPKEEIILTDTVTLKESAINKTEITKPIENVSKKKPLFSGYVEASGRTDFKESEDTDKSYSSDMEFSIGANLSDKDRVSYWLPMSKDLRGSYEEKLSDSKVTYTRSGIYSNGPFLFQASTSAVIPTKKDSKVRDEMTTALEVNPQFIFKLDGLLTAGSNFLYIPRYKRAFHKYSTNRDGDNLVEQSLVQFYVLTVPLNDYWTYTSTFIYVMSRGYNGTNRDHSYLTVQDISVSLTDKLTWNAGIETGGKIERLEKGKDKTVSVFDENISEFYTGLNLSF